MPSSAYVYGEERFELPVEIGKWTVSGGVITNQGDAKYYEYIDMKQGRWGVDECFFYVSWETVGSRIYTPGSGYSSNGLTGLYYAYFGIRGKPDIVVSLAGTAKDISATDYIDISTPGWGKVFEDLTDSSGADQDVPGPNGDPAEIGNTFQEGTGFDTENSGASLFGRVNGNVVEVALDLSSLGLTKADMSMLDYAFIGTAESNPSAPSDLFANDHFVSGAVQFDNAVLGTAIPEASSALLAMLGASLLCLRRRAR